MCVYVSMGMYYYTHVYICMCLNQGSLFPDFQVFCASIQSSSRRLLLAHMYRMSPHLRTCGALELPKAFLKLQPQTGSICVEAVQESILVRGEQSKRMKALQKEREGGEEGVDGRGSKNGMS